MSDDRWNVNLTDEPPTRANQMGQLNAWQPTALMICGYDRGYYSWDVLDRNYTREFILELVGEIERLQGELIEANDFLEAEGYTATPTLEDVGMSIADFLDYGGK